MSHPFTPALQAIEAALQNSTAPLLVTVDGRCASGKTSFATLCARRFPNCNVFHLDDFFLPPEKRTPKRLAAPGGNVDYERALRELFVPLSRRETVCYAPFDCSRGDFGPTVTTPYRPLNLVEGSYSHHPVFRDYPALRLFLTCSPQVQQERLAHRAPEKLDDFLTRWIPMEEHYFSAWGIPENADQILDTTNWKEKTL